jgi:hypothetical protein
MLLVVLYSMIYIANIGALIFGYWYFYNEKRSLHKQIADHREDLKRAISCKDDEFKVKFGSYIEHNRSDILRWKNTDEDVIKKLETRLNRLEKLVLPQ